MHRHPIQRACRPLPVAVSPRGAALLLLLVAGLLSFACGEGSDFMEPVFVTQIRLQAGDCAGLTVGDECTMVAEPRSDDGEPVPDTRLFWSSNNVVVAVVSNEGNQGVVSGRQPGDARITVRADNGVSAQTTVRVADAPPPPPEVP